MVAGFLTTTIITMNTEMRADDISDLVMMPFEAIEELRRRQRDPELKRRVE